MITIRAMGAEDLDLVLSLERRTPEAPHWDRTAYERCLVPAASEMRSAWVAEDAGELVGFAVARQVADVCELESIVVVEGSRRKGTGKALMEAVLAWAGVHGAKRLELEVRAGNENALRFYERGGLVREGVRPGYYREPDEDAILMGSGLYSTD
jgi:[ribosomal protein S18]-alanine N-acetyltransferase